MNRSLLNISFSLLALFGAVSCNIKEDMSNCPGRMILDYSYYPDEVLEEIASDERIDLFIFNPEGVCCDTRSFTYSELSAQEMEFELPIGYRNYNAVVWQGLNGDMYDDHTMVIGAHYDDFYLSLAETDLQYEGVPEPLWATPFEPIEYCAKITRHRVYMTRLHTEVDVRLQEKLSDGSLVDLDEERYTIRITAPNGEFHTDCTLCEECEMTTCTNEGDEVGTLRLTPEMTATLSVDGVEQQIDLVEYMLKTKSDGSLSDQQFLDINKIWDIALTIEQDSTGYLLLGINVNGWVTWFTNTDLSK